MKIQAFIPAAGLGTRLKPLTDQRPKALVEVDGKPLLELLIEKLSAMGASPIVINVHHFGEQIVEYIESMHWNSEIRISDERELLLDTGGGLKRAEKLLEKDLPALIHNVDVIEHINLEAMYAQHIDNKDIATLAVSERDTSRYLLFDPSHHLAGWHNRNTEEYLWVKEARKDAKHLAFSGIALVEPQLLDLMPEADRPYPIIPAYLEIAKHHTISSFEHSKEDWLDVGKPETLAIAAQKQRLWKLS